MSAADVDSGEGADVARDLLELGSGRGSDAPVEREGATEVADQPDVGRRRPRRARARPRPAPATSFRNGDAASDSRRRRPSSGERRRGGKSRRGGKGRPERGEYSGSSEYSGSARAAPDATSREADEKTATARSTRASVTVKSQVETPDTTPAVTVTVSCPASPEPGVGTGGIRVDPP